MAWRSGSFSRSLVSAARAPSLRQAPPFPRLRPPLATAPLLQPRPFSFVAPRNLRVLGCAQSLLPLHDMMTAARLTSHLTANARACCELSHGT